MVQGGGWFPPELSLLTAVAACSCKGRGGEGHTVPARCAVETHQSQQSLHLITARSLLLWRGAPCVPLLASLVLHISECLQAGWLSQSTAAAPLRQHGVLLRMRDATKQCCWVPSVFTVFCAVKRAPEQGRQVLLSTAACCSARALFSAACCCGLASVRRCLKNIQLNPVRCCSGAAWLSPASVAASSISVACVPLHATLAAAQPLCQGGIVRLPVM